MVRGKRAADRRWTADQMPSQRGRVLVVTGGASGLGLEISRALAAGGAHVVVAARSLEKANTAAERIRRTGVSGTLEVRHLDLASLSSIRTFADGFDGADVLINNAGVMALPESRTPDGFETQIGTNHLGHFALANLLLPKLTNRVVGVASRAHKGELDVDDLNMERRGYSPFGAYSQSKLAILLFVAELQRRLTAASSSLRATAAHPGYTSTGIQAATHHDLFNRIGGLGNTLMGMHPSQGALSVLYAATMDLPGNSYVGPDGWHELWGWPAMVGRSPAASDPDLAKALWLRSEALTGVSFPF